jgi:molybdopterin/thiamine biosynthesis adenylyltransferase
MPVLDMVCRDRRITQVTLIEPDVYKQHNVERHVFPRAAVGRHKADLAAEWLKERRPELEVALLKCDLCDPLHQQAIEESLRSADLGICAADNEPAKYHWDGLMRRHGRAWSLGEVLSGGIGGFVHRFVPGGPCYGCVASHLQRALPAEKPAAAADYSQPAGPVQEATVPASRASIEAIASLHALITLSLLPPVDSGAAADEYGYDAFTSLLLTLRKVPDVFDEAFRPYRFRVPRRADCLICQAPPTPTSPEELDVALHQALARLGDG